MSYADPIKESVIWKKSIITKHLLLFLFSSKLGREGEYGL